MLDLVKVIGPSWKSIASSLNQQFSSEYRSRTAHNVKDKYKSLEKATQVQILSPKIRIKFSLKDEGDGQEVPETRYKVSGDKITVYSKTVRIQEIFSKIIGDVKDIREKLISNSISKISWTAVQESL